MNFVAATCPSCGGSLQVPDDRDAVKCMYCGGEIIVRQAINLAAGRVQSYTSATKVERTSNSAGCGTVLLILSALPLLFALATLFGPGNKSAAVPGIIVFFVLVAIGTVILRQKGHSILMGYKGDCPYCGTKINFPLNAVGLDCFACNKRIVFREMKFYSIDTPVGFARKPGT
jgi:predicted RNA-binding Zn-ribbon protein involved in translation (DUF1610 family)